MIVFLVKWFEFFFRSLSLDWSSIVNYLSEVRKRILGANAQASERSFNSLESSKESRERVRIEQSHKKN